VAGLLATQPAARDALLPALQAVQARLGHVPEGCVEAIAGHFNLTRADVWGVVTFYSDFSTTPGARHRIEICRAEACQALGARELVAHASRGCLALDAVYCLGNCACGPSVRIGEVVHGRVTPARFDALVAALDDGGAAT